MSDNSNSISFSVNIEKKETTPLQNSSNAQKTIEIAATAAAAPSSSSSSISPTSPNATSSPSIPSHSLLSSTIKQETNDKTNKISSISKTQQQQLKQVESTSTSPAAVAVVALAKRDSIQQKQQLITISNSGNKKQPQLPPPLRQPRPIRPNLRRQVIVSHCETSTSVPVMTTARPIELATVLPPGASIVTPPKRPAHLPARYALHPSPIAAVNINSSAAGGAVGGGSNSKPNRYAWAQVQQWQAAQNQHLYDSQQHDNSGRFGGVGATTTTTTTATASNGFQHHFSSAASRVLIVNPMHIVNISKHTKSRLIKSIEAIKKFSEKWFSHVLLLLFLAVYACFGAYIFISFEAPTENWEKQLIIETRLKIVNDSWFEAKNKNQQDFLDLFRLKFEDYERLLNRACANGMNSNSLENQWTFWGALFYSMTVFTTIGYGHLTPITFAGRVATMIYAIFGIPILLMVLADLGKLLTRIIKFAFKKFRYLYNKLFKKNKTSQRTKKLITDNTNQYIGVARGAFKKGIATYIEPNYQKIPKAATLLREKLFWRRTTNNDDNYKEKKENSTDTDNKDNNNNSLVLDLKNNDSKEFSFSDQHVSSDVIITPNKQSKPVSPQINEKKTTANDHPLNNNNLTNYYQNQHHNHVHHSNLHSHHNQHHNSSADNNNNNNNNNLKSKSLEKNKRKISTTQLINHSKKNLNTKSSLSRSSSSSIIGTNSNLLQQQQHQLLNLNNEKDERQQTTSGLSENDKIVVDIENIDLNKKSLQEQLTQDEQIVYDCDNNDELLNNVEQEEMEEEEEEDDFDIPVSFAVFLLIVYMMFGAVIFSIWEGWNFFDSLYFVFISMSTIGFGDLVPQHPKRMIGTFIYLLFGLALTSMCINVVQEKIHATFLRAKMQIGEKMGFDLDQIMADDYYGSIDGCNGQNGDCGDCDCETCNYNDNSTHSVAVSQTNSTIANLDNNNNNPLQLNNDELIAVENHNHNHQEFNNSHQPELPNTKLSKSKESLKMNKKRNIASLPGHNNNNNNNNNSQNNFNSSSSFRRKSTKRQPISRQLTPATNIDNDKKQQIYINKDSNSQNLTGAQMLMKDIQPIKSEFEIIKRNDVNIVNVDGGGNFSQQKQPNINMPVKSSIAGICEPLLSKKQSITSTSTIESKLNPNNNNNNNNNKNLSSYIVNNDNLSLMNGNDNFKHYSTQAIVKSHSSENPSTSMKNNIKTNDNIAFNSPYHCDSSTTASSFRLNMLNNSSINNKSNNKQMKINRSAGSSRRSSVSQELNQLDDLIMALKSQSKEEKFGPLLGIPTSSSSSSRLSRSLTPNNNFNYHQLNNNNNLKIFNDNEHNQSGNLNFRRGTSMTNRPTYSQQQHQANNHNLSFEIKKENSLILPSSSSSRSSFRTTPTSSKLILNQQLNISNNREQDKNSRSTVINLSASQKALAELEAIKYSNV